MADALFPLRLLPTLPSFPWPAPLVLAASPFPLRPSPPALQHSPHGVAPCQSWTGAATQALLCARSHPEKPTSCKCHPCADHPTCKRRHMSPTTPMPKHGAAGVTCGACTSTSPVHLLGIHRHHSGTTGRYQLVSVTGAPIRTVVWVMTRVSSVPLKPLRFMCALKCFAMSAPWLWGWDSSH